MENLYFFYFLLGTQFYNIDQPNVITGTVMCNDLICKFAGSRLLRILVISMPEKYGF